MRRRPISPCDRVGTGSIADTLTPEEWPDPPVDVFLPSCDARAYRRRIIDTAPAKHLRYALPPSIAGITHGGFHGIRREERLH